MTIETLLSIFLAAGLIMTVSLIGVVFAQGLARRWLEERLPYLISFSAGVFLVTAGGIALEVFELTDHWLLAIGFITGGYLAALGLQCLLPETHHHHDSDCRAPHGHSAQKILIGDSLHNVTDGIILVSAFVVSPWLGVAVTVAILIHETLQELSEFFVLRQAGYSVRSALTLNLLSASTILIGVVLSLFALAKTNVEVLLLAFSAGFFLNVVLHDLVPRPFTTSRNARAKLEHLGLMVAGVVLMGGVSVLFSGGHEHSDHAEDHNDAHESEHHDEPDH
jgi:zinc and cadmium transporter